MRGRYSLLFPMLFCLAISLACGQTAVDDEQLAQGLQPVATATELPPTAADTPEPTKTPLPTNTPEPTATDIPAPTDTPPPTVTRRPTATRLPTNTPTARPTNTPVATATQSPPTLVPSPVATQVPTEPPPPAEADINIIAVNKQDEYADIRNDGGQAQDLSGWMLRSERGNQDCWLGGVIQPGQVLRIWALASDAGQGGYNCGFGSNIWNNSDPDPAVLFNAQGQEVDRFP